jgi:hypothetical protein
MASLVAAVAFAGAAAAQADQAAESLSRLSANDVASLDTQSIRAHGGMAYFDVRVGWGNPEARPPEAPASRVIRYVARCGEKTLGVAAVTTFSAKGAMMKRYRVPPDEMDFASPREETAEAGWLAAACRS